MTANTIILLELETKILSTPASILESCSRKTNSTAPEITGAVLFVFADTDARSYQNDITSRDLQYLGTDDSDDYDEEEKQEPESVVSLETAISIATSALHSMEYGSSIDDLVVEVDSSMRANCFDAVRTEE